MRTPLFTLIAMLTFSGLPSCRTHTPPATTVESAPKLDTAAASNLSQIAGAAKAQSAAIAALPDSDAKEAIAGENEVIAARAGEPSEEDAVAALERVNTALRGDLKKHADLVAKATAQAALDKKRIAELERQVKVEQGKAAIEIARLKREADEHQTRVVVAIAGGVSGLVLLASIGFAVFQVWSGTATPKGLAACGLGAVCAVGGFCITQFLAHPWIPYVVGGIVLLLAVVGFVMWAKEHYDLHAAKEDFRDGLSRVGQFMRDVRASVKLTPEAKEHVQQLLDGVTDASHQEQISEASK